MSENQSVMTDDLKLMKNGVYPGNQGKIYEYSHLTY